MLSVKQIEEFVRNGFVAVRQGVPTTVVQKCQRELNALLSEQGVDIDDPLTWTQPVIRFPCPETEAFAAAGTQPALWDAYGQLLGPHSHVERRGVGGTVPVRFPSTTNPGDAGWHIDGSFPIGDLWGVNVHSAGRGLLALFLFSDVEHHDAPTEIKVGSHHLVPPMLTELGEDGGLFDVQSAPAFPQVLRLPSAFATGSAGDVFLCHPFLVHRATWPHRGTSPRFIAQPGIATTRQFALTNADHAFPVEQAIIAALPN